MYGLRVNLVGKKHNIIDAYLVSDAVEVENAPPLPYGPIMGKPEDCFLLAIYRLDGGAELDKVLHDILRTDGGIQPTGKS